MSFATCLTAVKGHCVTVGNAVTPNIKMVRSCDPMTEDRQITLEYGGTVASPFGGHTLGKTQDGKRIIVKFWLPVLSLDKVPLEAVEAQIEDVDARLRAAIMGDVTLGDPTQCIGVVIDDSVPGKEQMVRTDKPAVFFRTLEIPIIVALPDVATIAS